MLYASKKSLDSFVIFFCHSEEEKKSHFIFSFVIYGVCWFIEETPTKTSPENAMLHLYVILHPSWVEMFAKNHEEKLTFPDNQEDLVSCCS